MLWIFGTLHGLWSISIIEILLIQKRGAKNLELKIRTAAGIHIRSFKKAKTWVEIDRFSVDTNKLETMRVLEKFKLNTSFLQVESAYYKRKPSYSTALRLAQKYLDYSLYLDKDLRRPILNITEEYLNEAQDLLDEKQSNYKMISQKLDLLVTNVNLYQGNYRKVERFLKKKINEEELRKYNWGLYTFLNYCMAIENGEEAQISKWTEELEKLNNSDLYKTRAKNLQETS